MGFTKYPNGVYAPNLNMGLTAFADGNVWFVDGDNGSDGNLGDTPAGAKATIQAAVTAAAADGGVVYVKARDMGAAATDPVSYAETVIIPAGSSRMAIIGVSGNNTQGGLPQIKKGSGSTALLTVRAPGCLIANMGFNGASSTGGGILLDSDGGTTKDAFGTKIIGCHFKNCVGSTATSSATGGAIQWSATGGSWQVRIEDNVFYKNVGGVVLLGTTGSVPQDVIIKDNYFMGTAATVDSYLYLAGGSGMASVAVTGNVFASILPALASGAVVRYADLTGCTGIFANNYFAGVYTTTGFGAAKAAAKIPTTVGLPHNYTDSGLIVREA